MDELKAETIVPQGSAITLQMYPKAETDAVIKEKDRALEFAKALTLKDIEIIKEKDKEIAELKAKLESEKASHYADSVDAGMRERRLKRALWLARAERAKDRKYKYETWERNETKKFNWDGDLIAILSMKARKWRRVEIKCLKKAEEYK